jgi:ATP-dependent RNA helicase RhlE
VDRIEQSVTMVNQAEKAALLAVILQGKDVERALVFSRTKHGADKIVRQLEAAGLSASAIHGNKSQPQRERAIAAFKSGEVPVLIATDIAARGIDIPGVSHVVNFDLPDVPEQYVHRIGRTARAGATGIAVAFCAPDERGNLSDIERTTRQRIAVTALPEGFAAAAEALKRLKPAPKPQPERRPAHTKADRRHDGQRRQNRNAGLQRQPQRDGSSVYRPEGGQGQNSARHEQRSDRQPTRPAEAGDSRNSAQQRHPQRSSGHPAHRPEGGQGKPKFRGRRRFGGGNRQARG